LRGLGKRDTPQRNMILISQGKQITPVRSAGPTLYQYAALSFGIEQGGQARRGRRRLHGLGKGSESGDQRARARDRGRRTSRLRRPDGD